MKKCPTCKETYPNDFAVCPRDGSGLLEAGSGWSEGTLVRGKYRILNKLGQGGMGAVYKALHIAFDEMRAIKVMNPELISDDLFVKRFKHEAVITRKLQHPNAVRVDDIDETEDGRPFIVMEFIQGESLKKVIQEQGALPMPRVCSIIKQVAAGLEAAHRLGMVHRDIKPDNIVLIELPQGEIAKVLDFGIAKIMESRAEDGAGLGLTGTGVIIGTPQYMSPEQAMGKRGDDLDGRSDLYSLGVVMYQMLVGETPFKADSTMDMLMAHLQKQPPPLQSIRPELGIPEGIANLVARLLEKKPEARVPSAGALIEEIEKAEKELAGPPLAATRVMKPVDLAAVEAAQAAPAPAAAGESIPTPVPETEAPAARPRPSPPVQPSRPAVQVEPSPPPAHVPAPKSSMWLVWTSVGILVVVLGGGGVWYKTMRHPSAEQAVPAATQPGNPATPQGGTPTTPQGGNPSSTVPAQSTSTPATSNTSQQSSPQPTGQTATPTQTPAQQAGTPGGKANAQAPSTTPGSQAESPQKRPAVDRERIASALRTGKIYFDQGKYQKAINEYKAALELEPRNPELRQALERARKAKAAEDRINQ